MEKILAFLYDNRYILAVIYMIIINTAGFVLCGMDKIYAVSRMHRISERSLLSLSFFGGASGMLIGMIIFRHKTRKSVFAVLVPVFILLHIVVLLVLEARYSILSQLFL